MSMPDFLVIGAAKSGTISLYHYLNEHPQIFMSPVNETNFFALENADFDHHFQGPLDRFYLDRHCIRDLKAYQALFLQADRDQILGECSPLYLYDEDTPDRIRHHIPDVKLIAILRHPTDRAYANYRHFRRAAIEPLESFGEALEEEPQRIREGWGPWPFWHYRRMGFYADQLQRYCHLFDDNQIFIETFDNFRENTQTVMGQILDFLEVDSEFVPNTATRHNIGGIPRSRRIHRLLTTQNSAVKCLRRLVPLPTRERIRRWITGWNLVTPDLDPGVQADLDQGYASDIRRLENLIGRDLTSWK